MKIEPRFLFNLILPTIFFIFILCFMPIGQVFQFDQSDEGIELIKASLYSKGFALYTQMWNDQPPLSTVILSHWLNLFGHSVFPARLLTLCFSTVLVWSFCQTLRIYVGNLSAVISTILLIISSNFLKLSVSVMFGLPSLSLAMLSIYTLTLYKQQQSQYLIILSGGLLALSLQLKLFTLFILPLMIFELLVYHRNNKNLIHSLTSSVFPWIASLSIVFILVGLSFNSLNYEQLVQSHFSQNVRAAFNNEQRLGKALVMLLQDFDYLLLAIPGIIVMWQKKEWNKCFPLIWLVTAIVVLANQRPVWYHHYLLLSMPLAWLAAYGVQLSLNFFEQPRWYSNFKPGQLKKLTWSGLAASFLIFSVLLSPIKLAIVQAENHSLLAQGKSETLIVDTMLQSKASTKWVFTDSPIYAFYSGLLVPPEIAVLSRIRVESGDITTGQLLSILKTYRPEQVLLGKFKSIRIQLSSYLSQHYSETSTTHLATHYILKEKNE